MALIYNVPKKYYFRLHQIRPRFKDDVENVLIFMALKFNEIPRMSEKDFKLKANEVLKQYPGNIIKKDKTIRNWTTEISSLFGLIEYDSYSKECWPSAMVENLSEKQDLVQFFKYFLYYFQYPGGHLKPKEIIKVIKAGIKFKPARYILKLLQEIEAMTKKPSWITKAELTHCVFNDLRVTRDQRDVEKVARLILDNRKEKLKYESLGDKIRYAGDILDYMVIADLLNVYASKYFLNKSAAESILAFTESKVRFHGYDNFYGKTTIDIKSINILRDGWFHFVNQKLENDMFKTDIISYLGLDKAKLPKAEIAAQIKAPKGGETIVTKEIGDYGEHLIFGHECMRLKQGGREDLIGFVQYIPTSLKLGFDIQSIELDGTIKRYIEVKSTISNQKIKTDTFSMTPNEWGTAESNGTIYYIYRLMINKGSVPELFIIHDPVGKYKTGLLRMRPVNSADITFTEKSGDKKELLSWQT